LWILRRPTGGYTTYTCSRSNVTVDFTNVATASGTPAGGGSVADSHSAQVDVIGPAIAIDKLPGLQTVQEGGMATFTITVTNTGDAGLVGVAVTDALAPQCNGAIGLQAAGHHTSYTCTLENVTAGFTNTASVTGTPPDGEEVSDSGTARVKVAEKKHMYMPVIRRD
jgi:uncharacterized repeat protein (TIGR01451 family)